MERGLRQLAPSAGKNFCSPRQRGAPGHSSGQSRNGRNRDDQSYDAPLLSADTTWRSGAGASPYHGGVSLHPARQGRYTNVDGQKMIMEEGDLILTPQWAWHEHAHEGDEPIVWIDGLDVPFIQSLQVVSFQPYNQGRLAVSEGIDPSSYYGMTRPIGEMDSP